VAQETPFVEYIEQTLQFPAPKQDDIIAPPVHRSAPEPAESLRDFGIYVIALILMGSALIAWHYSNPFVFGTIAIMFAAGFVLARYKIVPAFAMASDEKFVSERKTVLEALKGWAEGDPVLGMRTAETLRKMAEPKKNDPDERTRVRRLTEYLDHILSWYADLLSLKVNEEAPCMNPDYAGELHLLASKYSTRRLAAALRSIMKTRRYIEGNITPQLALENMFFDLMPDLG